MRHNNYSIEWSSSGLQINISFTNVETETKYETTIHEQDIKIGSTKKLITMLKNCINSVQDYNLEIEEKENNLIVKLNYNSDLLDLQEIIILQKLSISQIDTLINQNTKLKKRIEQLENKISAYENIPNIIDFMNYSDIIKYGDIRLLEYMKNKGLECVGSGYEYQSILQNLKQNSIQVLQWLLDNNFNFEINDFVNLICLTTSTCNTNCEEEIIIQVLQWFKNNFYSIKESDSNQKISGELFKNHKKSRARLLTWFCESTNLVDYSSIISTGNIQLLNLLKSKGVEFNTKELQTLLNSNLQYENILEVIEWLKSEKYFSNYKYTGREYHSLLCKIDSNTLNIFNLMIKGGYRFTEYHVNTIIPLISQSSNNLDNDSEIIKVLNLLKEHIPNIFMDNYPFMYNNLLSLKFTSIIDWFDKNGMCGASKKYLPDAINSLYFNNISYQKERFIWIKRTYGINNIKIQKYSENIILSNWLKDNGFTIQYI